ncbi:MAG: hypothetical protein JW920_05280 [Deltaproteobacteria bacterium]|nr:hypothetical protein [Deltaproteobacteria bacterium]
MIKCIALGILGVVLVVTGLEASQRHVPEKVLTGKIAINFNCERLNGYYVFTDTRSEQELTADEIRGGLNGPAIVFFSGHGQRPADAHKFSSELALKSKSGIVIVPVCDTPYGSDPNWRGDRGKEVVLMAMIRYIFAQSGIRIEGYAPLCDISVKIQGLEISEGPGSISTQLVAVGWSHGAILARRFCYAYPDATLGLAQVCPAGFERWSEAGLLLNFLGESLRISKLGFTGYTGDVLRSGWGLTKGIVGDFARSVPSALVHLQPGKCSRLCKDIQDCTLYCDDQNFPLSRLRNIVVVFARDDTCMDPAQSGVADLLQPAPAEVNAFWHKYFPGAFQAGTRCTLQFLPGTHAAPVTHNKQYAHTVLKGLDLFAMSEENMR